MSKSTALDSIELTNDPFRPFPPEEFHARILRVRETMVERGIDLLVISEANNLNWLTGYSETAAYQKVFVLIAQDEDRPIWIGRDYTCAPTAEITTYLEADQMVRFGEQFATHTAGLLGTSVDAQSGEDSDRVPDAMTVVADTIKSHGWHNKRIGVEDGSRLMPYRYGNSLRKELPNATFVDATLIVDDLRTIKSPLEIKMLRQAATIANSAMRTTFDFIRAGVRECDIAAEIFRSNVAGTVDYGGNYPEGIVLNIGSRVPAIHSNWSDRVVADGELITIEMGGSRYGYHVGICRSAAIGYASNTYLELSKYVDEAYEAVFEAAVAGATSDHVAQVFTKVMEPSGFKAREWIAYSMGIGMPCQAWAEPRDIRLGEAQQLQPNTMFHIVPCFWVENIGWALMHSDSFLIKETGSAEVLTNVDRKVFIR